MSQRLKTGREPRMGFFNISSDEGLGYPKFTSFQHRQAFIRQQMLDSKDFLDRIKLIVAGDQERAERGQLGEAADLFLELPSPGFRIHDFKTSYAMDIEDCDESARICPENLQPQANRAPELLPLDVNDETGLIPAHADNQANIPQDLAGVNDAGWSSQEELESQTLYRWPDVLQLEDHLRLAQVVFVGDKTDKFFPRRGDLIVHQPGKERPFSLKGYLTSYEGPQTHRFEHGELVLRLGEYEEAGPFLFFHKPYRNLELYQYNMDGSFKYLGSQGAMRNFEIPVDSSPGKYLKVGSPVKFSKTFKPLVPRSGDVMIKRAAWEESVLHAENFWRSMVKWHRDGQDMFSSDDLLLRLFVDKHKENNCSYLSDVSPEPGDHSACVAHGPCLKTHAPPFPGFAELYGYGQPEVGWIYWGRTELLYDTPFPKARHPHLILYVNDDGREGDVEVLGESGVL